MQTTVASLSDEQTDIFPVLQRAREDTKNTIEDWSNAADWEPYILNETAAVSTSRLGRGTYGVVECVRHVPSSKIFAVKSIDKRTVVECGMTAQVENEIRFQMIAEHPNVLKGLVILSRRCYKCVDDDHSIHMFMECCLKGDLYQKLKLRPTRRLEEEEVFIYFVQLVNGLSYIHSLGYFHRDLKLENLLVGSDPDETLRIADFGWVGRILGSRENFNFCGTLDYLCPEMIEGSGHDWRADIWSAGILLYEMLVGAPPFHALESGQLISNIMLNRMSFPPHVGKDARDVILSCLQPNPDKRTELAKVVEMPWIKNMWNKYVRRVISTPITDKSDTETVESSETFKSAQKRCRIISTKIQ